MKKLISLLALVLTVCSTAMAEDGPANNEIWYTSSDNDDKNTLPQIHIQADNISSVFTDGTIQLDGEEPINCYIRFRGASALSKQKKSFAIKLKYSDGEKYDLALLGMREDNYWILDAMAIDAARMRNRVSMDLWNDFSRPSFIAQKESKMRNGTDGKFVELYLNDEYWGLYCLSERLDRKQLKLKKFNEDGMRGALYKSVSWSTLYSTDVSYYVFDNYKDEWNGWEISYPSSVEDDEPIDWQPLADVIHWLSYSSTSEISAHIESKIDVPVWQDYFLLMEFICAEDNVCKNQYVYFYDVTKNSPMLGVAPWDMDHSWGRDYSGKITSRTNANFDLATTYNRISQLLHDNESLLEETFEERYAELRTSFFEPEFLKARFKTYFSLFKESGAALREQERWSGADDINLDFDAEELYICQWIDDRIRYMDKKYNYSVMDGIQMIQSKSENRNKIIYRLDGQSISTNKTITTLPHGFYIINGKKIIR